MEEVEKYLADLVRVMELGTRFDLADADDLNLEAVTVASQVALRAGNLEERALFGAICAAYVAGRLRGRQEWTIQVQEETNE